MFRKNRFIGVDIRNNKIAFAILKLGNSLPEIQQISLKDTNLQLFEGGIVRNEKELTSHLRSFYTRNKITKNIHFSIPTKYQLIRRITTLPDLMRNELSKILSYQIGDEIQLPFEKPVYDFI